MYLYPMGDESNNAIDPKNIYKSAEVIDVESDEYEEDKELLDSNNQYKRITKEWLIAQEVARLTLFASGTSWLFLVFRSINWFPLVIGLFVLSFLVIGGVFSLSWGKLSNRNRIRLFVAGILTGFSAAISGSDIIYYWFISNQVLALSIMSGVLIVLGLIGFLAYKIYRTNKVLRY